MTFKLGGRSFLMITGPMSPNVIMVTEVSAESAQQPDAPLVRVYCDGVFDMFHYGHARALEQARSFFPSRTRLIVGVCEDGDVLQHKGSGRPVMSLCERIESLRHCKWVDEIISNAPWIITDEFLEKHAIDYVAHDDAPYACVMQADDALSGSNEVIVDDCYAKVKAMGKFLATKRTNGVSTTELIERCRLLKQ